MFEIDTSFRLAIVSTGLSIFTKYIPGKVLVILGPAAYVSAATKHPVKLTSTASLVAQLMVLWSGSILGCITMFSSQIPEKWAIVGVLAIGALTLSLFFQPQIAAFVNRMATFFNYNIGIPCLEPKQLLTAVPYPFFSWTFLSVGFYLLVLSVHPAGVPDPMVFFIFPLAGTLAIAALFAPGGLGVREGLLVACMTIYGIPLDEAVGISILSRLWFLVGEMFIFVLGFSLRYSEPVGNEPAT